MTEYFLEVLKTKNGVERYYEVDSDETMYLTLHYKKAAPVIWKSIVAQAHEHFKLVHEMKPSSPADCWYTLIFDNGIGIDNGLVLTNDIDDSSIDLVLRLPYSEKALMQFVSAAPEISGCCRFFRALVKEALDELDITRFGSVDSNL